MIFLLFTGVTQVTRKKVVVNGKWGPMSVGSNVCTSGVQCLYQLGQMSVPMGPMSAPVGSNVCTSWVQCLYQCCRCQLIRNIETLLYLKISRARSPLPWNGVPAALHTAVYRTVKICVLAVRVSVGQSSVGQLLTGCLFCTC